MTAKKLSIILLTCVLIIMNFVVINQYSLFCSRLVRGVSSLAFMVLYAWFGGLVKVKLTIALVMFFLADVCIIFYDDPLYNNLTSLAKSLAFIFMGLHFLPKFKLEFENKKLILANLLIISFSAVFFVQLVDIIAWDFNNELHSYLYTCCAFFLMVLLVLVGNYNFRYNSIQSTTAVFCVISLVASDVVAVIYYYLDMEMFFFPTRFFYIIGLAFFTAYVILPFKEEELYVEED